MDSLENPNRIKLGFMNLPLEIRAQVYEYTLQGRTERSCGSDGKFWYGQQWCYNLCSTCHQVRQELLPLLLRGQRVVQSYRKLLEISEGPSSLREMMGNLMLDLSPTFFKAAPDKQSMTQILQNTSLQLGQLVLRAELLMPASQSDPGLLNSALVPEIWGALHCFPNIKSIRTDFADLHGSPPAHPKFRQQADLLLEMISLAFPHLLTYETRLDFLPFSYIKHFQDLRHLHFRGMSKTPQKEILSVLQSLKHLKSVTVEQWRWMLSRSSNLTIESLLQHVVITPDTLSHMNPLTDFAISSWADPIRPYLWYAIKLTRPLMEALRTRHQSLQNLKIVQGFNHPNTEREVLEIIEFVYSLSVPHVYVDLTLSRTLGLSMDPKHFLPRTIGKQMDIFAYLGIDVNVRIGTGKYLPSPRELAWRKKAFEINPEYPIPNNNPRWRQSLTLDSRMEHSISYLW